MMSHEATLEREAKRRAVEELTDLDGRVSRLGRFLTTNQAQALGDVQYPLLVAQYDAMRAYQTILAMRLKLWRT